MTILLLKRFLITQFLKMMKNYKKNYKALKIGLRNINITMIFHSKITKLLF